MMKVTKGDKYKSDVFLTSIVLQIAPMANAIDGAEIVIKTKRQAQIDKACQSGQNMTCLTGRAVGGHWDCF